MWRILNILWLGGIYYTWCSLWVERRTVGGVWRPGINWCGQPGDQQPPPSPTPSHTTTLNPAPSNNRASTITILISSPDHPNMTSLASCQTPPPCLITKPLTDLPISSHYILSMPTDEINPESLKLVKSFMKCVEICFEVEQLLEIV